MTRRSLLAASAVALAASPAAAYSSFPWGRVYSSPGSPSPQIAVLGDLPAAPRKTVLLLGQGDVATLTTDPLAPLLTAAGYTVCCVSTPCHDGQDHWPGEPWYLGGWAHRLANGRSIWDHGFIARASIGIDRLVEAGYTDPTRVAVAGRSRGCLAAAHWAAADARARWLVMCHPVTELLRLSEFAAHPFPELCAAEDVGLLAPTLAARSIYWTVNAYDTRVSTQATIGAYQACVAAFGPSDLSVPDHRLTVVESGGHATPAAELPRIVAWLTERAGA